MKQKTVQRYDSAGQLITEEQYNHLAAAEMSMESNYNQIDGVLNGELKPAMDERMKKARSRAKEHNAKKSEKHKTEHGKSKTARHKDERHKKERSRFL